MAELHMQLQGTLQMRQQHPKDASLATLEGPSPLWPQARKQSGRMPIDRNLDPEAIVDLMGDQIAVVVLGLFQFAIRHRLMAVARLAIGEDLIPTADQNILGAIVFGVGAQRRLIDPRMRNDIAVLNARVVGEKNGRRALNRLRN